MKISPQAFGTAAAAILAATFAALVAAAIYFTPLCTDDLYFVHDNWDLLHGLTGRINWSGMWDTMVDDHLNHNGRFGDRMAVPLLSLLPHWVFSIATGLMVAMIIYLAARMARGGRLWGAGLAGATALVMLFFPWCDHMTIGCFAINYVWASALVLLCAYLFLEAGKIAERGVALKIGVAALFVVASPWHEQTCAAFGAAMLVVVAANWLMRNCRPQVLRWRTAMLCFWGAGSIVCLCSPSLFARAGDSSMVDILLDALHHRHLLLTPSAIPSVIFLILSAVYTIVATARHRFGAWRRIGSSRLDTLLCICFVVVGANLWFFLAFGNVRILAPGCVFSAVGILDIAWRCAAAWPRWARIASAAAVYCLAAAVLLPVYVEEVIAQRRLGKEYAAIMQSYGESPSGLVCTDFTMQPARRTLPWQISNSDQWSNPYNLYLSRQFYFRKPAEKPLRLIPADMGASPDAGFTVDSRELESLPLDTLTGWKRVSVEGRKLSSRQIITDSSAAWAVPIITEEGDTTSYYVW